MSYDLIHCNAIVVGAAVIHLCWLLVLRVDFVTFDAPALVVFAEVAVVLDEAFLFARLLAVDAVAVDSS